MRPIENPSLLPFAPFSRDESDGFDDLEDAAEIDAIVEALFPASLTNPKT